MARSEGYVNGMQRTVITCDRCKAEIAYPRGVPVAPSNLDLFLMGAKCVRLDYCEPCTGRLIAFLEEARPGIEQARLNALKWQKAKP
jgi:hypothetical protein